MKNLINLLLFLSFSLFCYSQYASYCEGIRDKRNSACTAQTAICPETIDTSVTASPATTGTLEATYTFDFKLVWCVNSTYIG